MAGRLSQGLQTVLRQKFCRIEIASFSLADCTVLLGTQVLRTYSLILSACSLGMLIVVCAEVDSEAKESELWLLDEVLSIRKKL